MTEEEEVALVEVAEQVEAVRDIEEGAGEVLGAPASYWLDRDYRPVEVAAGLDLPMLVLRGERAPPGSL